MRPYAMTPDEMDAWTIQDQQEGVYQAPLHLRALASLFDGGREVARLDAR